MRQWITPPKRKTDRRVVSEAGREAERLGGLQRKAELGHEGYVELGRRGGQVSATRQRADNIGWVARARRNQLIAKGKELERGEA